MKKKISKGRVLTWILGVASVVGAVSLFAKGRRKLGLLLGTCGPTIVYRRLRRAY